MDKNSRFSESIKGLVPEEERLNTIEWLAEQMPGGFFVYQAQEPLELLYVNQATCDIFGCSNVEELRQLTGNSFRGMVHPEDYKKIQTSIDDQISSSENNNNMDYVVYRIIRKDGSIRWVDDYGHFTSLPGYGDVYYVFIGDITDNRLAAEEKEKSINLAHALEEAEQANVAKSAFLSNMSHEIRTPITAILGMNEMIQRESSEESILEYSENIRKAGVSLLGIISDILDFSKIETGRMELENDEYSLRSMIGDLYNLVRFRTEAKGLSLSFHIDQDIPCALVGDEIRVKQVITNLLTNAVKYTETGSVTFEIKLEQKTDEHVRIMVSVSDTGIGIKNDEIDKLFEPFDRLDVKKTRSIEGSGLGLAISSQILEIMNSELKVESTYGEGSKFWFVLEQKIADPTPVGNVDPGELIHDGTSDRRRHTLFTAPGMRLLVVDDTPMNLQVVAGLLKRTCMHIDVATSGEECIEKFAENHYDLVFLDYRMPGMNGIETLLEIKKRFPDKFEETPIISLTASAVSGDKEKMLSAGFTDYLTKPVNIDEMERMMIKYLPADSVIMTDEDEAECDDEISKLPDMIFDIPELDAEKGIEYCGDAEDYIFALETYEMSVEAKAQQIQENFESGDIESYTINVHSLKSTSGAIGAMNIFEKAKALELAGKSGDIETLRSETQFLLRDYRQLKDIIRRVLDAYDRPQDNQSVSLDVVEEERSRMLSRALEEAERANMAKTAFLSNMSHEIRTPMNAIIGLYNIALRKNDLDEDTRDILTRIGSSAKHLLSLINDILDISRIESGHTSLKNEVFDIGTMIEQINTMTESQCDDRGLEFECRVIGSIDDNYIGDDMKLKQTIINILGNAVKYTPAPGKVTFTVEEQQRHNDKAMIRFVIADTGVGMDADYIPKIFDPFSKEKEGTSNSYGSTGLGMAITKNIIDMMCGSIEVESEKGKGSTFTVTIPLGICTQCSEITEETKLAGIRTLVVDDDITACEHARMVLARVGIKADHATGGQSALEMLEKHTALSDPYKMILIDWKMPGMDGVELTRTIRTRFGNDITIILTTYNWDEIMEEALEAGVDAFLAKPLFAGNIKQEIASILEDKKLNIKRSTKKVSLAGKRVLLAEDMEINALIMKQILNMKEIEADMAKDGREAVSLFEESEEGMYAAILMDIRMPQMNGLEATGVIRNMQRTDAATIPIIALTANAFDDDVRLSLEAGMNAHLSKPVEPDALFATLEGLIS